MDDCTHDCASCQAACSSRTSETDSEAAPLLMKGAGVKRVFAVMGGKGGAGRSVTACALAAELQRKGCAAGVLDADITGPSAAAYLGIRELSEDTGKFYRTVRSPGGVQVMASNVVLQEDRMPIAWRGALSAQTAVMFWTEVLWQDLDILFVDFPAGLDDVPIVAFQTLPFAAAVLVSRPTRLSLLSAEKCAEMATASDVPIAALVINGAAQEELTEEGKSAAEALSRRFSWRIPCTFLGYGKSTMPVRRETWRNCLWKSMRTLPISWRRASLRNQNRKKAEKVTIEEILEVLREYLDGQISRFELEMDFPIELARLLDGEELRPEERDLAENLSTAVVTDGIEAGEELDDGEFYALMEQQMRSVSGLVERLEMPDK